MPSTKPVTDEWLHKKAAAKLLGVSDRQLDRRAEEGWIQKKRAEKKPSERVAPALYSQADIRAILAGAPNNHARIVKDDHATEKKPPARAEVATIPPAEPPGPSLTSPWRDLALQLAGIAAQFPTRETKPWLNLEEAAAYSGLPVRWLRQKAEDGSINAINVSVAGAYNKHWRFNREALGRIGE